MASFWTTRGIRRVLEGVFQGEALPDSFYVALVKATTAPTRATTVMSGLSEIATGSGYLSGGLEIQRDSVDFDTLIEDTDDFFADLQLADVSWTATGGSVPASGNGARYAVLTDDNATVANREVWFVWDLQGERSVSVGQALTLRDLTMRGTAVT